MFRIRRIHDDVLPVNRDAVRQVQEIFRYHFTAVRPEEIEGTCREAQQSVQAAVSQRAAGGRAATRADHGVCLPDARARIGVRLSGFHCFGQGHDGPWDRRSALSPCPTRGDHSEGPGPVLRVPAGRPDRVRRGVASRKRRSIAVLRALRRAPNPGHRLSETHRAGRPLAFRI